MVKLKLQILLIPAECASLPTAKIESLIAKKFLHLIDPVKQIGELLDAVVAQFQRLYPEEPAINVVKCQDKNQCDLDKDYQVEDVFELNDEVRVIVDNLYFNENLGLEGPPAIYKRSREEMEGLITAENSTTPTRNYLQPVSSPVSLAPPQTSSLTKIPKKKMNESPGAKASQRITSGMLMKPPTASPSALANNSDDDNISLLDVKDMGKSFSEDDVPIIKKSTPRIRKSDLMNIMKKQSRSVKKSVPKIDSITKSLQIDTNEGHPYLLASGAESESLAHLTSTKNRDATNTISVTSTPSAHRQTPQSKVPQEQPSSYPAGANVTLSYKEKSDSAPATGIETPRKTRGRPLRITRMSAQKLNATQDTTQTTRALQAGTTTNKSKEKASAKKIPYSISASLGPIERIYDDTRKMNVLDSIDFNLNHLSDQVFKYKTDGVFKKVPKHFAVSAYSCESVYTDPVVDFRFDLSGELNYGGPLPYSVKSKTEFEKENNSKNTILGKKNSIGGNEFDDEEYEVTEVVENSSGPDYDDDNEDDEDMHEPEEEEEIGTPKRKFPTKSNVTSSVASLIRPSTRGPLSKSPRAMGHNGSAILDGHVINDPNRYSKSKSKNSKESDARSKDGGVKPNEGGANSKTPVSPKMTPKKATSRIRKKKQQEPVKKNSDDDSYDEVGARPLSPKSKFEALNNWFPKEKMEIPNQAEIENGNPLENNLGGLKSRHNPTQGQENEDLDFDRERQQQSSSCFSSLYTNLKRITEDALNSLFYGERKPEVENQPSPDIQMHLQSGSADPSVLKRADKSTFGAGDAFIKDANNQQQEQLQLQDGTTTPKGTGIGAITSAARVTNGIVTTSPKFPLRDIPASLASSHHETGSPSLQLYGQQVEEQNSSSSGSSDVESIVGEVEEEKIEESNVPKRLVASEPVKRSVSPNVDHQNSTNKNGLGLLLTLRLLTSTGVQKDSSNRSNGDAEHIDSKSDAKFGGEEPTQVDYPNGETDLKKGIHMHDSGNVSEKNASSMGNSATGLPPASSSGSLPSGIALATSARKPVLPTLTELRSRGVPEVKEIDELRLYKGDKKDANDGNISSDSNFDEEESVVGGDDDDDDDDSLSSSSDENENGTGSQLFLSSSTLDDKKYKKSVRAKKNLFSR